MKKYKEKMKDELQISEYIGLRSKLYSVVRADEQVIKKGKKHKKYVIKKQINFENYKDALYNKKQYSHKMNLLRSLNHNVYGITVNKINLNSTGYRKIYRL